LRRLEPGGCRAYHVPVMRIRWKVLILLLTISMVPFGVAFWFGRGAARRLGDELAAGTREALREDAERFLVQVVRDHGRLLQLEVEMLEHDLEIQARAVERCLAGPPPDTPEIRFASEFESETAGAALVASQRHVRVSEDGTSVPMQVSHEHQSFFRIAAVDPREVADDLARLSTLLPTYRLIHQSQRGRILWQYTALASGVHTAYPGHGYYPKGFDPRQRPWFSDARARGKLTWGPPMVDASTRQVVLTLSMPVHHPDGSFAGVTGFDVRIIDLLRQVDLPAAWAAEAETMVVVPLQDEDRDGPTLLVISNQRFSTGGQWDVPVREQLLTSEDGKQLAELSADLRRGRAAIRTMPYQQRRCLWAYGPLRETGAALVVIVPWEHVLRPALAAEAEVRARVRGHRTAIMTIMAVVIAAVVTLSMLASRQVTRPISELAAAAHRIAAGDLDTPTRITTRDELGELGATVNAMLPQLRDRIRLKQSLALAMEVQQNLLPQTPPRIEGLDVAGRSIYCDETGGDYYDFVELSKLSPKTLGVAVGDVTGHGLAAALLMATARALLRSWADQPGGLGTLLSRMNRHLARDVPTGKFMTLSYLLIDTGRGTVRWASAGHDPAIAYQPREQVFSELAGGGGIPLGIEAVWEYEELGPEELQPGQVIVIGTDGVWEARNEQGEMFGKQRLREIIHAAAEQPAEQISRAVTDAVAAFRGSCAQDDDITLVVVKVEPQ
jgi:sigma-B regulation protein RsbU (phosphoserine phosphatase)